MTGQLPDGAVGPAVGVFIYTTLNLVCSSLMIWLTWVHGEKLSYVALISYFAALSIVASMIQQLHDYVYWKDVLTEQFAHKMLNPTNPELAIANGSVGMDLALYYIQYYAYSVEAMFVLFWAVQLAQSVYGLAEKSNLKHILRTLNNVGKIISVVLPLITVLCLRIPAVQSSFAVFILLADLPLMLSMALGLLLVFAILARYMNSRRKFLDWSAGYYNSATGASNLSSGPRKVRQPSVYDRWLLVRFTIAFVLLGVFEVTNTLFQISAQANNKKDEGATSPDFSVSRAVSTIVLFMPGVTPGLVIFIVFGTTRVFRNYMYTTFVPKMWQRIPERAPRPRADSEAGLGGRMRTGSFASRDALRQMAPNFSSSDTRDHFSATDESLGIKLQELELGRNSAVPSHSSDERPILLPVMKQAYHRR